MKLAPGAISACCVHAADPVHRVLVAHPVPVQGEQPAPSGSRRAAARSRRASPSGPAGRILPLKAQIERLLRGFGLQPRPRDGPATTAPAQRVSPARRGVRWGRGVFPRGGLCPRSPAPGAADRAAATPPEPSPPRGPARCLSRRGIRNGGPRLSIRAGSAERACGMTPRTGWGGAPLVAAARALRHRRGGTGAKPRHAMKFFDSRPGLSVL